MVYVLDNDTLPDTGWTLSVLTVPANGVAEVIGDDKVKYTGAADFIGEDTFAYEVCFEDVCWTATVTVTIDG